MKTVFSAAITTTLAAALCGPALAADPAVPAPRFAPLTMEQLNVYQKPLGEQIMKVSSVGLGGPYNPMIRSPVLGQRLYDLFYYLRWQTSKRRSAPPTCRPTRRSCTTSSPS